MTYTMPSLDDLAAMTVDHLPDKAFDLAFDDEGCLSSYWVLVDARTGAKEKIFTAKGGAEHDSYMQNTEFDECDYRELDYQRGYHWGYPVWV